MAVGIKSIELWDRMCPEWLLKGSLLIGAFDITDQPFKHLVRNHVLLEALRLYRSLSSFSLPTLKCILYKDIGALTFIFGY